MKELSRLSTAGALEYLGALIDDSTDSEQPDGLRCAVELETVLRRRQLNPVELATLEYFLGNAWSGLRHLAAKTPTDAWEWHREEIEKEVLHFRSGLRSEGFSDLTLQRKCQILTNLGNAMSSLGRFIDAVEYYKRAIALDNAFGMACGNRGLALCHYARALYDPGHALVLLRLARESLDAALRDSTLYPGARAAFQRQAQWTQRVLAQSDSGKEIDLERWSMRRSKSEVAYRQWCAENTLFLNPLNDLGPLAISARDVLTTPSIVTGPLEGLTYAGFFNQMKQEFVSARFLCFQGLRSTRPHFSDRDVLLYNTLDFPSYSLAVEQTKATFRAAYSIFDKVAYLLNDYLQLEIPEREIAFRSIWYQSQNQSRGLRQEFKARPNLPLRGLFWLSKDLYDQKAPGFRNALEPDATELAEVRNHLEHKYLKLHEYSAPAYGPGSGLVDSLAHSLARRDFEAKTLRLLKLSRAALIYLSLAIHAEEQRRAKHRDPKTVMPMVLDQWEDEWKV